MTHTPKPLPLSLRMGQCLRILAKPGAKASWSKAYRKPSGWWTLFDPENRPTALWSTTLRALQNRALIDTQDEQWDHREYRINAAGLAALRAWEAKYQDTWESLGHGIIEVEPKDE